MDDPEEPHLPELASRFLTALSHRDAGRVDAALDTLRTILLVEPRLAEPRMEIARIYLDMGRIADAEEEVRESIRLLERDGRWLEEVTTEVLLAMCWAILGEVLKERASSDEVVFGDPKVFHALVQESRAAFIRAAELDPDDVRSQVEAAELGPSALDEDDAELPDNPLDVRPSAVRRSTPDDDDLPS